MKVLIAGDFCPLYRVGDFIKHGAFETVFNEAKSVVQQADFSLVNLECPVSGGEMRRIRKCGPNLKCTRKGVEALAWTGFKAVTLANNHFLDFGQNGVVNTLNSCKQYGLDIVGGGQNLEEASHILYKEVNEGVLAVINCCEHEFSLATANSAGSNPLNPIRQYYAITEAKLKADYVLVIVHGGHEHFQLPSPRMQDTYRFFIDAGADAVVNHHQHCYSGYEVYKGRPIFYGIGNFCFDEEPIRVDCKWNFGYMVTIDFQTDNITFKLHPYNQCSSEPVVRMLDDSAFDNSIKQMNAIIADRKQLETETKEYFTASLRSSNLTLEPITNRYIRALQNRHLLPEWPFSNRYILRLYNFLLCESHRDKINYFLQYMYDKKNY